MGFRVWGLGVSGCPRPENPETPNIPQVRGDVQPGGERLFTGSLVSCLLRFGGFRGFRGLGFRGLDPWLDVY